MWSVIVQALIGLAGSLLKTWISTPPAVAVEAQKLGAVTQTANDDQAALQNVQKAQEVAAAVERSGLAGVRQPDPDSRD